MMETKEYYYITKAGDVPYGVTEEGVYTKEKSAWRKFSPVEASHRPENLDSIFKGVFIPCGKEG